MQSNLISLTTPCLVVDSAKMTRNIARLADRLRPFGVTFRPHLKTAKCIEIAQLMMPTVQGPATVSTLREAELFAAKGVTDILYAVGIAPAKLDRVIALRRQGIDVAVILDTLEQAKAVAEASRAASLAVPVLIEIDSDGHRSGVGPNEDRLLDIARVVEDGAQLRGVMTHAGGSYGSEDRGAIERAAEHERNAVVIAAERLRRQGFTIPVVSVGSTPTAHFARNLDGVTEVRAGVYVFFDLVMAGLGVCSVDDIALSVLATVIGHQPDRGWTIVDAGWTALSRDRGTASQRVDQGYGLVCDVMGHPFEDLIVTQVNQEHGVVGLRPGSVATMPNLPIGSLVRILPNHACATAVQHAAYQVLDQSGRLSATWSRFSGW